MKPTRLPYVEPARCFTLDVIGDEVGNTPRWDVLYLHGFPAEDLCEWEISRGIGISRYHEESERKRNGCDEVRVGKVHTVVRF